MWETHVSPPRGRATVVVVGQGPALDDCVGTLRGDGYKVTPCSAIDGDRVLGNANQRRRDVVIVEATGSPIGGLQLLRATLDLCERVPTWSSSSPIALLMLPPHVAHAGAA